MTNIIFLKNPGPDADADGYAVAATARNFSPHFLPVLSHEFVDPAGLRRFLDQIYATRHDSCFDALIVTSQRAVEAVAAAMVGVNEDARRYIVGRPVYTVGPATASLLRSHGFTCVLGGAAAGNGRVLAGQICDDRPRRCLFLTGAVRRDVVPVTLRQAGIECVERVVYESADVPEAARRFRALVSRLDGAVWTVFFSPSGALEIAKDIAAHNGTKVAAIGPTTEEFLLTNSITPDCVAKKPDPESLLDGIVNS